MKKLFTVLTLAVCACSTLAKEKSLYETGTVLEMQVEPFSNGPRTWNLEVYLVQLDNIDYSITSLKNKLAMIPGQHIACRVENGRFVVLDGKGKDNRYRIVKMESIR